MTLPSTQPVLGELVHSAHLTPAQLRFISHFQHEPLSRRFYLAGGAGLSAGYLGHRFADDLDFFGPDSVPVQRLIQFMKQLPGLKSLQWLLPRERTTFLLTWDDDSSVKVEYRRFDWPLISPPVAAGRLYVESLEDLIVDKIAALTERHYPLDRVDILLALEHHGAIGLRAAIARCEDKFGLSGQLTSTVFDRLKEAVGQASTQSLRISVDLKALHERWIAT